MNCFARSKGFPGIIELTWRIWVGMATLAGFLTCTAIWLWFECCVYWFDDECCEENRSGLGAAKCLPTDSLLALHLIKYTQNLAMANIRNSIFQFCIFFNDTEATHTLEGKLSLIIPLYFINHKKPSTLDQMLSNNQTPILVWNWEKLRPWISPSIPASLHMANSNFTNLCLSLVLTDPPPPLLKRGWNALTLHHWS